MASSSSIVSFTAMPLGATIDQACGRAMDSGSYKHVEG